MPYHTWLEPHAMCQGTWGLTCCLPLCVGFHVTLLFLLYRRLHSMYT